MKLKLPKLAGILMKHFSTWRNCSVKTFVAGALTQKRRVIKYTFFFLLELAYQSLIRGKFLIMISAKIQTHNLCLFERDFVFNEGIVNDLGPKMYKLIAF